MVVKSGQLRVIIPNSGHTNEPKIDFVRIVFIAIDGDIGARLAVDDCVQTLKLNKLSLIGICEVLSSTRVSRK